MHGDLLQEKQPKAAILQLVRILSKIQRAKKHNRVPSAYLVVKTEQFPNYIHPFNVKKLLSLTGQAAFSLSSCYEIYASHFSKSSSHLLSTSCWKASIRGSFSGLNRCLNLPCNFKNSSNGCLFFGL